MPHFFYPSLPFPSALAQFVSECWIESGVIFTSGSKNNPKIIVNKRLLNMRWNVFLKCFYDVGGGKQYIEKILRFFFPIAYGSLQNELLLGGRCFSYHLSLAV